VQGGPLLCWLHASDNSNDNDSSNQQQSSDTAATTDRPDETVAAISDPATKQSSTGDTTATDTAATAIVVTQRSPSILLINPKVQTVLQEYDVLDRPLQDVCYVTSAAGATHTAYVLHGKGTVSRLIMSYKDLGIPDVQIRQQTASVSSDSISDARTTDDTMTAVTTSTDFGQQQQQHNAADTGVSIVNDASTAEAAVVAESHADETNTDADSTLQQSSQSSSDAALIARSEHALQQAEALLINNNTKSTAPAQAVATTTTANTSDSAVDDERHINSSEHSVVLDSNIAHDADTPNAIAQTDAAALLQVNIGSSFSSSSDGMLSPTLKELLHDTDALIRETHTALHESDAAAADTTDTSTAPTATEVRMLISICSSHALLQRSSVHEVLLSVT
jgi:hypothetical protein